MDNLQTKDTILLVDDEPVVLDVGALMVKKLGYNVLQAANGMEASQIFRDNVDDICLVILDMILPDESGLDTCKKLKEIKSDVKVCIQVDWEELRTGMLWDVILTDFCKNRSG